MLYTYIKILTTLVDKLALSWEPEGVEVSKTPNRFDVLPKSKNVCGKILKSLKNLKT